MREIETQSTIAPPEPVLVEEEDRRSKREKLIDDSLEQFRSIVTLKTFRRSLGTGAFFGASWVVFGSLTPTLTTLGIKSGFFEDMDAKKAGFAILVSSAANVATMRPRVKLDVKKNLKSMDVSTTLSSAFFKTFVGESNEENGRKDKFNIEFSTVMPTLITSPLIPASFEYPNALVLLVAMNVSGTIANTSIVAGSKVVNKGAELIAKFRRNRE